MNLRTQVGRAALITSVALATSLTSVQVWAEGFYGELGAVYLKRDAEDELIFSVIPNNPDTILSSNDQVLMTSEDLDVDWDVGGKGTLGYSWDGKQAVEVSFMGVMHEGDASITSDSMSLEPSFYFGTHFGVEDFRDAYRHDVSFESDFYDLQLNYRRNYGGRFTSIVGLRGMKLDETFDFIGTDTSSPGSGVGRYGLETENTLFGMHLGGDYEMPIANNDALSIQVTGTGGVYYNKSNKLHEINSPTPPVIAGRPTVPGLYDEGGSAIAGSVEGSAALNWSLNDQVSFSAGYQALFLTGITLFSENYMEIENDGPTFFSIKNGGSTVFHGGFLKARVDF